MERIYDQAKDQNVAALLIYGKEIADNKAYLDEDCTVQFKTSELKDAFIKRAVIKVGNNYFAPVAFTVSGNFGTVIYAKAGSESGSAATVALAALAD